MKRVLLLNVAEPEEMRAGLVEDGSLSELLVERGSATTLVGNVYKGRVVNVERGIGAAFLDVGIGRNAFLHESDCLPSSPGGPPSIEAVAERGEALVQVTRESIGAKGPVLTMNVSLPGRFLVLLPFASAGGVSRRIEEADDRDKLRAVVRSLEAKEGVGLIVRTAGAARTRAELTGDLRDLKRVWAAVLSRFEEVPAPALLYEEGDLLVRALRDLAVGEVSRIVVDTPEALARARDTLETLQPGLRDRLRLHDSPEPLFHAYGAEEEVDRLRARRVPLPGGGSLVFDSTEALVAVDVNSGRTQEEGGLEETALKTNLEAAGEVARQLRLRDLGGVVVVDFIDMREPEHVRRLDRAFRDALRGDRARVTPGRMGPFGIFALTRRRTRAAPWQGGRVCPQCRGTGRVPAPEAVALRVYRELQARVAAGKRRALRALLDPEAAAVLESTRSASLDALRAESGAPIRVQPEPGLPPGAWRVESGRTA